MENEGQQRGDQVIEAALKMAAEGQWHTLTMARLSEETGLTLNDIHRVFPTKASILKGYIHRLDHRVLDGYEAGENESTRDRLFDLMMGRFDEFSDDRDAVIEITRQARHEPDILCAGGYGLWCSMRKVLESAHVQTAGCRGHLRIKGLCLIFTATFKIWLEDASEDMSRTMAALDQHLACAEMLEQKFSIRMQSATIP